jgi:hypothetical protein
LWKEREKTASKSITQLEEGDKRMKTTELLGVK